MFKRCARGILVVSWMAIYIHGLNDECDNTFSYRYVFLDAGRLALGGLRAGIVPGCLRNTTSSAGHGYIHHIEHSLLRPNTGDQALCERVANFTCLFGVRSSCRGTRQCSSEGTLCSFHLPTPLSRREETCRYHYTLYSLRTEEFQPAL
jgi:hypothetical protein